MSTTSSTASERMFEIGQTIQFRTSQRGVSAAAGEYQVVGYRPTEGGEVLYRIKSGNERHERIARDGELSPLR
jgi:hypothetical protein